MGNVVKEILHSGILILKITWLRTTWENNFSF